MTEKTDKLMKQFGFTARAGREFCHQSHEQLTGQSRVLVLLLLEDGIVQNNLAEILDVRPSSLAELIKKMEASEDVRRVEDDIDKRSKHIYLTEQGRVKAQKLADKQAQNPSETFFAGLSEEEVDTFSNLLDKVANGWNDDFKQQAEHFFSPFDRMKAMQDIREKMIAAYPGDWEQLSDEEKHKIKKAMREEFRNQFPGMDRGPHGHGGRGHGHGPHGHGPGRGGCHGERGERGERGDFEFHGRPRDEFFAEFFKQRNENLDQSPE